MTRHLIAKSGSFLEAQLGKPGRFASGFAERRPQSGLARPGTAGPGPPLQSQTPSVAAASAPDTDAIARIVKNLAGTSRLLTGQSRSAGASVEGKAELLDIRHLAPNLTQALLSGATISPQSPEAASVQTQLLLLVLQLAQNSLAKIRAQQLGIEAKSSRPLDSPASSHQVAVDLPVRWGEQIEHARIGIEEDTSSATSESPSTVRTWLVKLHINTAAAGDLYIHLRYCQERIGLSFWAQSETLLSEAKSKLNTVREAMASAGLEVSEVKYFQGRPEGKSNNISYNLVDIKT